MALAAYGDIGFRVPSVAHARYYHEVGTKTFVFNFDTHEKNHWLVGAGHADELKYFHRWHLAKGDNNPKTIFPPEGLDRQSPKKSSFKSFLYIADIQV